MDTNTYHFTPFALRVGKKHLKSDLRNHNYPAH